MVKTAPSNCFGYKLCLCVGAPCYTECSTPLFRGTKNADKFLAVWRQALLERLVTATSQERSAA